MNKVLIKKETLSNIANAIRDKLNDPYVSLMNPSMMSELISNIDTEKVTIDGEKVREEIGLKSFSNIIKETQKESYLPIPIHIDGESTSLSAIKRYILFNGDLLFLTKNTNTVTLSLTPSYDLETITSEITIDIDTDTVDVKLHENEGIWLEIRRRNDTTHYFSVYKINISNSSLSVIQKCSNIQSQFSYHNSTYPGVKTTFIDSTGIYATEKATANTNSDYLITTYQFSTSNTQMKTINSTYITSGAFVKKGDEYYYFYEYDKYCCLFRNNPNSFTEVNKTITNTISFDTVYSYGNEIYCMT